MKKIKIVLLSTIAFSTNLLAEQLNSNHSNQQFQSNTTIKEAPLSNDEDTLNQKAFGSGNYYLFVGASGANANHSGLGYDYYGAGCMETSASSNIDGGFDFNLNIPDGHMIDGVRFYFNDTNAVSDVVAYIFKFDGAGGATTIYSDFSETDIGFANIYDGTVDHVVNNTTGAYVLRFTTEANDNTNVVCGARLFIDSDPVL